MALVRLLWLALIFFCVDVTQSKRFFLAQRSLSFVYGRTPVFLFSCRELSRARVHDRNSRVPSQILRTRSNHQDRLGQSWIDSPSASTSHATKHRQQRAAAGPSIHREVKPDTTLSSCALHPRLWD